MATRQRIAAANWKMYKDRAQARDFVSKFLEAAGNSASGVKVIICPPFTALEAVREAIGGTKIGLGGQDVYWEKEGAYTGEISAGMLREAGCEYCIVGHSERRRLFGETDESVNSKLKACLGEGLTPIFCVGETLPERDSGKTEQVIWTQLTRGLDGIKKPDIRKLVMAYEPVWAIGTGRNATPEQAQQVHSFIREFMKKTGDGGIEGLPIIYGGSVKPDNVSALMAGVDVDGGLVGGASLEPQSFAAIAKGAAR